jgi:hypothetical protein
MQGKTWCIRKFRYNFDFDTQGIDMYVDEDWVRARGTHSEQIMV